MKHPQAQRFSHSFVINEGNALPEQYRGKLFAVLPLQGEVVYSDVKTRRFIVPDEGPGQGGHHDRCLVPPGEHPARARRRPVRRRLLRRPHRPPAAFRRQDRRHTGRVYRLRAADAKPSRPIDLGKLGTEELVKTARLGKSLGPRHGPAAASPTARIAKVLPLLTRMLEQKDGQLALEALWALNLSGGFDDALALKTLDHADPYVRLWTVRLLGDNRKVSTEIADKLAQLAAEGKERRGPQSARLLRPPAARRGRAADRPPAAGPQRGSGRHSHAAVALVGHRGQGGDRPRRRA